MVSDKEEKIIQITGLVKRYAGQDVPALNGIDLGIGKGEFFGLLGPNSAGKTTLIHVICGLLRITSGEVRLAGIDVKRHPLQIRKHIGLVPQEIALYPNLTLRENLEFFGNMHNISRAEVRQRVRECIEIAKLESHANKIVARCSGGIRRRANLVAGLIHSPAIAFLDEPTLGVDTQSRELIFNYLRALNEEGITIIYTTHHMTEAENLCRRIVIIDQGRVVTEGSPDALIRENPGCHDLGQVFLKLTGRELRD